MRYDTPVYFQKIESGAYNSETGDYGDPTIIETLKMGSVQDTRAEMLTFVYGKIRQGSVTLQLQTHYTGDYDHIRIGNTIYNVDYGRNLRVKQTYVLSEVQ